MISVKLVNKTIIQERFKRSVKYSACIIFCYQLVKASPEYPLHGDFTSLLHHKKKQIESLKN